ncbi:hypothetical protein V8G54_010153 [Vigna mungo]|uniref:Uncharacterized protein n=1 Tax=Vigna mungo TaxID=3915 RepID=A0AAQ3NV92_VIGMU
MIGVLMKNSKKLDRSLEGSQGSVNEVKMGMTVEKNSLQGIKKAKKPLGGGENSINWEQKREEDTINNNGTREGEEEPLFLLVEGGMTPKVKQQGQQMFLKFKTLKDQQGYTQQSITWKKMWSMGPRPSNKNPRTFLRKIFSKALCRSCWAENASPFLKSVGVENRKPLVEDYIQEFEVGNNNRGEFCYAIDVLPSNNTQHDGLLDMHILYIHIDIGILDEGGFDFLELIVSGNARRVLLESLATVTWIGSGEKFIQECRILVSQADKTLEDQWQGYFFVGLQSNIHNWLPQQDLKDLIRDMKIVLVVEERPAMKNDTLCKEEKP